MKRVLALIALTVALALGTAAPATGVESNVDARSGINAVGGAGVSAGVNDFTFDSFDAHYELSTDGDGRSLLTTTETLVAVFPEADQNRGIRRMLVESYDGHPTDLKVVSVTDETGTPRQYGAESDEGVLSLTIADSRYVHGTQTYVIEYTQHNVTRFFSDSDADEFYWDTNGTDWAQPFGQVTATVTLGAELMTKLNGNVAAFSGRFGSNKPAETSTTGSGFTFTAKDLGPRENLTFAIGFEPGTFEPRDDSFFAAPWPSLSLLFTIAGGAMVAWAATVRRRKLRDAPGRGIIIPEYVVPKDANVFTSAVLLGKTAKATTAGILKLAVAGNLRVLEVAGAKPHYQLQFLTAEGADADELEFLHALFGDTLDANETRSLKSSDQKAAGRITKLMGRVTSETTKNGYRRKVPFLLVGGICVLAVFIAILTVVFAVSSFEAAVAGAIPALFIALAAGSVVAVIALLSHVPLDARGVELRDYLRGLEQYIKLAEADRLRYLQSPQGALRTPVAADDPAEVVKLNEKLLPYAVLFGHEKEWAQELGKYYEEHGTQPSWYSGQGVFSAALLSSSIGTMATSTASTYSSSSGGSSGGGFSGGGGGGGGGGGV